MITAPSGATFQSELAELEFGPLHRFSDWPNSIVPTFGAGVYTIWQDSILVYVGMSGRSIGAETARADRPLGLFTRLKSHADENLVIAALLTGLRRWRPNQPSWFMERTPCGYRDPAIIQADLVAGGFADCQIEKVVQRGHAASPMAIAVGLCQGSPMRAEIEALNPTGLQEAT